jgi:peptidoglycan hydrolase CwlO-like protein
MKFKYLTSFFILIFFFFSIPEIFAPLVPNLIAQEGSSDSEDEEVDSEKVSDLEDKIKEYEEKVEKLNEKEESLAKEIEYSNSQINLTELRIANSEQKLKAKEEAIKKLAGDIEDLKVRIDKLADSIKYQESVLKERLRTRYKNMESSPIFILFGADTLNKVVQRSEYLKIMEIQDHKLLAQMNNTKQAYGQQKNVFEDKKVKEEELKQQIETEKQNLEKYQQDLENQKIQKQRLLEETQNDESKYQQLLDQAKRELNQMLGAVSVLKNQKSKEVEKGDIIGIQGNTGYSFGEHLHFGVYRYSSFKEIDGWNWYYSSYVDPSKVLKKKTVYWNTGCESAGNRSTGKGDWSWPVSNPTISQGFGDTCWSRSLYGGKPHPAYDMYGATGAPVYAADDGDAFFCRNCLGDGANGVFIFHDDDYMSVYWHLR